MQVLEALQEAVVDAATRVGPAVVGLGRGWGRGSGVVYEPGRVLTCAHVLRGEDVAVTFDDGRTEQGRVAGADPDLDLAVVLVETGDAPAVTWEPDAVAGVSLGTPVLALANPSGRGLRTTFGLVSATDRSFRGPRGRRIAGSIEHTAPLPRGSSGGPLVDAGHPALLRPPVVEGHGHVLAAQHVRARQDPAGLVHDAGPASPPPPEADHGGPHAAGRVHHGLLKRLENLHPSNLRASYLQLASHYT